MTEPTQSKPFLRVLKLAYKLHKAGLDRDLTKDFIESAAAVAPDMLPSAAAPVDAILTAVYINGPMPEQWVRKMADQLGYEPA